MDTPKEDGGATSPAERHVVVPVELLSDLWRYGNLNRVDGVLYGKSHADRLKEADDILCKALSAAPPVQMEAEPVGYQWLHIDQHTGAEFWHHNPRYNGEDSEVKRPVYASPIPSSERYPDWSELHPKIANEQFLAVDGARLEGRFLHLNREAMTAIWHMLLDLQTAAHAYTASGDAPSLAAAGKGRDDVLDDCAHGRIRGGAVVITDIEAMSFGFIRIIGEDRMCFWAEPGTLRPLSVGAYDPWAISDPLRCESMSLSQWNDERSRLRSSRAAR